MAEATSTTSRRTMLAGIAAAPVIAITGASISAPAAETAIAAMWRRRNEIMPRWEELSDAEEGTEEEEALYQAWSRLEEKIALTPSASGEDVRVKTALMRAFIREFEPYASSDQASTESMLLNGLLADIERLFLAGAVA